MLPSILWKPIRLPRYGWCLRVVSAIRDATRMLAEHPGIGRTGRVEGTRELVIPELPYILPYQVEDRMIRILTVMHTSRKWPEAF